MVIRKNMADIYLPSEDTFEDIKSLVQGFWLEIDSDDRVVLILKFPASIITSLVKGVPIELVLRNPKLSTRSITLYIYDKAQNPLWVTWQKFTDEDVEYKGFDEVAVKLVQSTDIRIAMFNELNHPLFTTVLTKENQIHDFKLWYHSLSEYDNLKIVNDGYYYPEDETKGFTIKINNVDNSSVEKLNIHSVEEMDTWGENWIADKNYYNLNEFLTNGKHGYNQELSIRGNLSRYFDVNKDFFHSPTKKDTTELIDFLIYHEGAILLIESKFVISEKQTKLNNAISKAVKQLNKAHHFIINDTAKIEDERIFEKVIRGEYLLKICLFNDGLNLTEKTCKNIINTYEKHELPIFISVISFFQLVADLRIRNEKHYKFLLIDNLMRLYSEFLESDNKIFIFRNFTMKPNSESNDSLSQ